jgi:cysteine desulfurase
MQAIYLDHAATSPLRPEVQEVVAPFLSGTFGNPSSKHRWGREARAALEGARERTAALLGVTPGEVFFTRGGTESINLAILGYARGAASGAAPETDRGATPGKGLPSVFLRSALEHSAVRESMDELARSGHQVAVIGVDDKGKIDEESMRSWLSDPGSSPRLASFQWANQETGILLPIGAIAERCDAAEIPLHVDAVQAAGKLPIDLSNTPISLLSISGHKFGGPKGAAVLVARKGVKLHPLLFGGGQEAGVRPGTEDVAAAVGFARAYELAVSELSTVPDRIAGLRSELESGLMAKVPNLRVHGAHAARAPHILSIGVPGMPRDLLPSALDLEGIGASAGSACRSGSTEVSPVMMALYGEEARSFAPLRLSLGWSTTRDDVEEAIPRIAATVERIRAAGVGTE